VENLIGHRRPLLSVIGSYYRFRGRGMSGCDFLFKKTTLTIEKVDRKQEGIARRPVKKLLC
jgi:hypothetical protein